MPDIAIQTQAINMVPAPNVGLTADSKFLSATDRKIMNSEAVKGGLSTGAKVVGGIATGLGVVSKAVALFGLETGPAMPIVEAVAGVATVASAILGGIAGIL